VVNEGIIVNKVALRRKRMCVIDKTETYVSLAESESCISIERIMKCSVTCAPNCGLV
jgi:hypothetical protein